ncbi:PREDICTED: E3 SUMO-protein ligase PIAS2-like [Cyprinodon variegatus]|uniref:E3 SUMO-protein ligase PIAS2-like n=1 Tax=Cyprinodon variegatus TaxID=28743 RepID=UPI000742A1C9|nr:PREDICTED: E3 SUMO-protein ligase PIAS2-like [Cyprinodon variegatus]
MNLQQPGPLIPAPVHPDVEMKPLPFYDVLDVLIKPSSLGASTSQRYHQEKYFIFALTPQQVREICISRDYLPGGRRDYMVQIQLRFCLAETSCPQEDNFPNSLCLKVNGKLFPLPGLAPPPKNGVEQKRTGRPLNITSLVRLSSAVPNQISVTWAPEIGKTYSLSVYLVRQLTSPLLLQRLRMKGIRSPDHSRALSNYLPSLGKMRLTVPCRAVTCSHLQCFDAALYLQMNEKKPTWICPVCDKKAAYENLIIDGFVQKIYIFGPESTLVQFEGQKLNSFGSEVKIRGMLIQNKSFLFLFPLSATAPLPQSLVVVPSVEPSLSKKTDVIDLTLESSSDDDDVSTTPPPKKQCVYISKTEDMHAKGVLTYQPSVRLPNVPSLEQTYLSSALAEYAFPIHSSTLASIPTEMQSLDLFSLIPTEPQHFRSQMYLENLSGIQSSVAAGSSSALVSSSSSSSSYNTSSHTASIHDTRGGGGGGRSGDVSGGSLSDIISLD